MIFYRREQDASEAKRTLREIEWKDVLQLSLIRFYLEIW